MLCYNNMEQQPALWWLKKSFQEVAEQIPTQYVTVIPLNSSTFIHHVPFCLYVASTWLSSCKSVIGALNVLNKAYICFYDPSILIFVFIYFFVYTAACMFLPSIITFCNQKQVEQFSDPVHERKERRKDSQPGVVSLC